MFPLQVGDMAMLHLEVGERVMAAALVPLPVGDAAMVPLEVGEGVMAAALVPIAVGDAAMVPQWGMRRWAPQVGVGVGPLATAEGSPS